MIFVTVGTHEQPFDRLIEKIDRLKKNGIIKEQVFIQSGYSKYNPKYCEFKSMISFDEMDNYVKKAKIIITHGGPGSIMLPLKYKKVPIVVPRQVDFKEHIDNHQVEFCKFLEKEDKIIPIYNIEDLEHNIVNFNKICKDKNIVKLDDKTDEFCKRVDLIAKQLFNSKIKGK